MHPSESGHWYAGEDFDIYKRGDQVDRVPGADGVKRVKPDRRHAKKFKLYPGVTSVIRQLAKPGLDHWKRNQDMMAFATLPEIKGEAVEDRIKRVMEDADQHAREAAEWGTQLHKWVQYFLEANSLEIVPKPWQPWVTAVWEKLSDYADYGYWKCEETVIHPIGYGGKVDLYCPLWVMDLKGREWKKKDTPRPYFDNAMQLAAYDFALAGHSNRHIANVFVNRTRPEVHVHEWTDEDRAQALEAFRHLLAVWRITNGIS